MQSINVAVLNPAFLGAFLGTAVLATVLGAAALFRWGEAGAIHGVAAVLYVIGCLLVTILRNVPLNDALTAADPESGSGADTWSRYLRTWVRWNHVQAGASLAASAAFMAALLR